MDGGKPEETKEKGGIGTKGRKERRVDEGGREEMYDEGRDGRVSE